MRRPPRLHRVGMGLMPTELERAQRAAKIREMPMTEFLRQAVVLVSDETLAEARFESDPFARRSPDSGSYPLPRSQR